MSEKLNSRQRWHHAIAVSLAMLGLAAVAPQAAAQQIGAPDTTAVASSDALTVIKGEDGKLRAPTGEEMQAMELSLKAQRMMQVRVAPAATQQKYHASGARGSRLTDEFMSTAVVVRNPDGSLERQCLEPGHSAQGVHSHPQANQPVVE